MKRLLAALTLTFSLVAVGYAGGVNVLRDGDGYTAQNAFYRIAFAKTGAIRELIFMASGKGIKSRYLSHDSLILNASTHFTMRDHAVTEAEIIEITPIEKQLIFRAAYRGAPAAARTEYTYTFYADKPIVKVRAAARQDEAVSWMLVRLNEFGIKNGFFSHWATGEEPCSGRLATDIGGRKGMNWKRNWNWSALFTDEDALGIIGLDRGARSFIHIYNAKRQYLNGKYTSWNSQELSVEQYLYIGPSGGGYDLVRGWARKLAETACAASLNGESR